MTAQTLEEVMLHGHGIERPFLCPMHPDTRPSASVNTIKELWVCYTCGARGKVTGEALLGDINFAAVRRHILSTLDEVQPYAESWLNQFDWEHEWWLGRFHASTCLHFRLGYDMEADRLTYPLRSPTGEVLGVVRRTIGDPELREPKYKYPFGIDVGDLLFNYSPEQRDTVVLVEGATDAMALHEVDVHAFGIYGSRLSEAQVRLIERVQPTRIITAFDMDDAGYKAFLRARKMLPGKVERVSWGRAYGKDVGELSRTWRRKFVTDLVNSTNCTVSSHTCDSQKRIQTYSPVLSKDSSGLSANWKPPRSSTSEPDNAS